MTPIKTGWLENGGMNSAHSAEVISVPSSHVSPAWIIHTLLNLDQCSKISAKMLFSDSDLFYFALSALEAI